MASDILLYDAVEVPVGDDQKQHVELARDICQRFNNIYGDTFALPEPVIPNIGARVMGFDNPLIKMSKSYSHIRGHAIRIIDTEDEILRTVKRAVTDSGNEIKFSDNPDNAGVNNLLGIYKVITGESTKDVESNFINSRGYGDLKIKVAEVIIEELQPIRKRYRDLMENPDHLDKLLSDGAEKARSLAEKKMEIVKNKIGLVSR